MSLFIVFLLKVLVRGRYLLLHDPGGSSRRHGRLQPYHPGSGVAQRGGKSHLVGAVGDVVAQGAPNPHFLVVAGRRNVDLRRSAGVCPQHYPAVHLCGPRLLARVLDFHRQHRIGTEHPKEHPAEHHLSDAASKRLGARVESFCFPCQLKRLVRRTPVQHGQGQ